MLVTAVISLFLDQLTKAIVRKHVDSTSLIEVIRGYVQIIYAKNTGAAFGMFRGQNTIFIVVSIIAVGFILAYYRRFQANTWMRISLGLLLGGALGNLADRILFQHVTDFIRVRYWLLHWRWWPTFNVADASICVGAVMLILGMLKRAEDTDDVS